MCVLGARGRLMCAQWGRLRQARLASAQAVPSACNSHSLRPSRCGSGEALPDLPARSDLRRASGPLRHGSVPRAAVCLLDQPVAPGGGAVTTLLTVVAPGPSTVPGIEEALGRF